MTETEKNQKHTTLFQKQFMKVTIIGFGGCLLLGVLGRELDKNESKKYRIMQLTDQVNGIRDEFYDMANQRNSYLPENITLKDANQDGLQDLVYKSNMIYFQTKEGKFKNLKEIIEDETRKTTLLYDSMKTTEIEKRTQEIRKQYSAK